MRRITPFIVVGVGIVPLLLAMGCHSSKTGGKGHNDLGVGGDISVNPDANPDGSSPNALLITPANPTITVVNGQVPPATQFVATLAGQTVQVNWSIDRNELGSISGSGAFTATSTLGGVGHVQAQYQGLTATTTVTVILQLTQLGDPAALNPAPDFGAGGYGGVGGPGPGQAPSSSQQNTLDATPTPDPTVTILYPYNNTVWPRGVLPPLVQWNQGSHNFDSVYVHIQETNFEYKGYFASNAGSNPFVNLPIPGDPWTQLGYSNAGEPVTVTLIFGEGDHAVGPYTTTWKIAQATLKGTVYYNSYGTYLVQNSDTSDMEGQQYGAGTLAIKANALAPVLVAGTAGPEDGQATAPDGTPPGQGCRVCHTVSAQGNHQILLTQHNIEGSYNSQGGYWNNLYDQTVLIDLNNDTTGGKGTAVGSDLTFPALYPDGSLLLSGAGPVLDSQGTSQLYSVSVSPPAVTAVNGVVGLPANFQAALPAFSPDGTHVSFNFWAGTFTNNQTADQSSLAVLDFDGNHTFSNGRILYTPSPSPSPALTPHVVWSSFLPTSNAVVFEVELYQSPNSFFSGTWLGNTGELWWVDLATKQAHRLDQLNGLNYLPNNGASGTHPPGMDAILNYEPTVDPIASGGYAWIVFTSRRMYGNIATDDPFKSDPRKYDAHTIVTDKKLWVAAIDLNATPGTDPSHPAFYLPAQELHAGNARGFWTTDACHADNTPCMTGDECCGGYCRMGGDAGGLVCSSQAPVCSQEFEKCQQTSDCCNYQTQPIACINNICTISNPT